MPPFSRCKKLLIIIATPIGNLSDLSKRALSALESCDAILAEDTRRSGNLLDHFGIRKKLISYHKFKEKKSLETILEELKNGRTYALISDAGTPCINDPGQILVNACHESGIKVDAIPGPCSVIQALVLSGFSTERFQFVGFLPKRPEKTLKEILAYPGTTVAFESPERLIQTLQQIQPQKEIAVLREMTKTYEECIRGPVAAVLKAFETRKPKGEIVLVFSPGKMDDPLSVEETVQLLMEYHGMSLKDAIKQAAVLKKIPKRDVYKKFHK